MKIIKIAGIAGVTAVVIGAFGAHTLKGMLSPEQLASFETGVRYQFYHTLALLGCGILSLKASSSKLNMAAASFLAGIILFSGSIYLLATRSITGIESTGWLGPITPIGGVFFILGWIFLFLFARKAEKE